MNDLPQTVKSQVRLFADDCLLYKEINDQNDPHTLQKDLKNLEQWANTWSLRFNPSNMLHPYTQIQKFPKPLFSNEQHLTKESIHNPALPWPHHLRRYEMGPPTSTKSPRKPTALSDLSTKT